MIYDCKKIVFNIVPLAAHASKLNNNYFTIINHDFLLLLHDENLNKKI